jgi:hypothetical protein
MSISLSGIGLNKMGSSSNITNNTLSKRNNNIFMDDIKFEMLKCVCKDYMNGMCKREFCKYIHDPYLCKRYWRTNNCKYDNFCRKNHYVSHKLYNIFVQDSMNEYINNKDDNKFETNLIKNDNEFENRFINNERPTNKYKSRMNEMNKLIELISDGNTDMGIIKKCMKLKEILNEFEFKQIEEILDKKIIEKGRLYQNNKINDKIEIRKKIKNTETFVPMTKLIDMRVIYDLGCYQDKLTKELSTRDLLLVPNLFRDFEEYEIYNRLIDELKNCGIPEDKVIIPWHGNNVIKGTHMIASDWEKWKRNAPTFNIVISRIREFFDMNIKATRLNWYQNTEQWKAFHFDAAKINPEKAKIQNFTVSVSFGRTRNCAFEKDDNSKNVISFPIGDGEMYCFTRETNELWRHGVLQELPKVEEGRISIVAWGWLDDVMELNSIETDSEK